MKLKTKRLLAAALAISLTANISLAAFAGSYDLADGSITINGGDSAEADTTVQQGEKEAVIDNDEITITQSNSENEATNNTVTIEGNVDNSVTIENVNIEVDESSTTDAGITIEENSTVSDLTINDSTITVDKENASGIEIGTGSEVDMTLSGDNEIILNEGNTSGIQVGTTEAEAGENTKVNITIDGTTTIGEGVNENGTSVVVNTNENLDTVANMTGGIVVGGNMADGAKGVDTYSDSSTTVTITGSESGGTLNIGKTTDENDNTVTEGVSTGILVHDGASVTIGDKDEDRNLLEVNIDGTHRTYANVENNHTNDTFVTVSGNGIAAYGNVDIAGSGTTVNIEDTDLRGISMTGGDLTISDGATVKIDGVGGDRDSLEQATLDTATTDGTSNTYAGIYSSGGSVYVDDANLKVTNVDGATKNENKHSGSTYFGVALDNDEEKEFIVSNGANVSISNIAPNAYDINKGINGGVGIGIAGDNVLEVTSESTVTVTNTRDGIYLNKGAILRVHGSEEDEDVENAKLEITGIGNVGITAYGADIEFFGDKALVKISSNGTGIAMVGPAGTGVEQNHLYVDDHAKLYISEVGYAGIMIGDEGTQGGADTNKIVEITDMAYVEISGAASNSIILYGGDSKLLIDNATVDAAGRISMYGGKSITVDEDTYKALLGLSESEDVEFDDSVELGVKTLYADGGHSIVTVSEKVNDNVITKYYMVDFTNKTFTEAYEVSTGKWATVSDATPINFPKGAVITPHTSEVVINNGSKVTASSVRDYSYVERMSNIRDANGALIVNGGTLELTTDTTNASDLGKDEAETLKNEANGSPDTWAVSGDENGGEELTNFKVSISYLKELQEYLLAEEENNDISEQEFFDKYGFVITSEKTNMQDVNGALVEENLLIIKTYGYENGNYIPYNENGKNGTDTTWYVVDLNKDYGENGELWIWTPAIVLSYYALDENKELEDAEDYSESNPEDPVTNEVATQLTVNHDVIYRGGSLIFDSFKTDGSLKTISDTSVLHNEDTAYQEALDKLGTDEYAGYSGLKIYNAYTTKDGWEDFDEETIVLLAEGTNFGYKNLFAPVKTDEPEEDPTNPPPPDTPDEPGTPETEPREPEEPLEPETPVVPVVPVTPETPAQPGETPAETPADPEAPAETPETPASSTPKTGDDSNVAIYLVMAALSGAALIGLGVTGRKKNEEV